MRVALTIAGSDSAGGAGLQADLRVFAAHGLHGTSAVTAVTAQNSLAVTAVSPLDPALVVAQIDAVALDMTVAAAKTGMLGTPGIVEAVAEALRRLRIPHLVVDPLLRATTGAALAEPDVLPAYRRSLFPLATVITPNLAEAQALLGRRVETRDEMAWAARELGSSGPGAVLVKGGHLPGDPVDVLWVDGRLVEIPGPRVETTHTHGTGCTLSAAIAARLALGETVEDAVRGAKVYLAEALRRGYSAGRGRGVLDQLHPLSGPRQARSG